MLEFITKYWLETLFTLICTGAAFVIRHHVKLIIKEKERHEKDILNAIDAKFDQQKTGMKEQMSECYNNLIEVVKESEDRSMEEDRKIHREIDGIKAGVLSIEGAYFKQECRRMLERDYEISSHDFETLVTEHGVYNGLGGNHEGDQLFRLVEEKYRNQLFRENQ